MVPTSLSKRPRVGGLVFCNSSLASLQDQSDDVRAVAAEALLPLAPALAEHPPQALQQILWDILLDVEELSPSTGLLTSHAMLTWLT